MLKAFKYRIYPTNEQSILISKHIGSVRFIYNLALETKQMAYAGNRVNLTCFDLINQLPDLKKECAWLKEINSQTLQQPIRNLDNAFTKFFKGQTEFPKFKKKNTGGSFNIPQKIDLKNDKLFLPKFRDGIKIILHRFIKGNIKQATISKTPTGKYFASILCETGVEKKEVPKVKAASTIGIDLGIKHFVITSDGGKYDNPRLLTSALSKQRFLQRKYAKSKGKITKFKIAILHEKVANKRKDFLHKLSTQLIRENQSLAIENLKVVNLLKNHSLARSISDCGWSTFVSMLEYKAAWYGNNILQIGVFEPSSKTCSVCGKISKSLSLDDREWTCEGCNSVLDRDINAAINIKNFALKNYLSVGRRLKNQGKLPTLVGALTLETRKG